MNKIIYTKEYGKYYFHIQDFKEKSCLLMINNHNKLTSLLLYEVYENIYTHKHSDDKDFLIHLENTLKDDKLFAAVGFTKTDKDHYIPIFTFTEDTQNFISFMLSARKVLRNSFSGAYIKKDVVETAFVPDLIQVLNKNVK
jgi:hypothetical protein